jgi:hypothetical protein
MEKETEVGPERIVVALLFQAAAYQVGGDYV